MTIASGINQTASAGVALTQPLTVLIDPGQSGLGKSGASILFSAGNTLEWDEHREQGYRYNQLCRKCYCHIDASTC
jgi:hypothetical protein